MIHECHSDNPALKRSRQKQEQIEISRSTEQNKTTKYTNRMKNNSDSLTTQLSYHKFIILWTMATIIITF